MRTILSIYVSHNKQFINYYFFTFKGLIVKKRFKTISVGLFLILLTLMTPAQSSTTKIQSGQGVFTEDWFTNSINHVNTTFWDTVNKGYFLSVDQNGTPVLTSKTIIDYDSFIELYLSMYTEFKNQTYITKAESLVSYLQKFLFDNESYLQDLNADWQPIGNSYFSLPYITLLLDDYTSLYNITQNTAYLNECVKLYNFIYTYFFDTANWGFFTNLDMSKNPVYGYARSPGYYMDFAESLLLLFEVTNNQTYLLNGLNIINTTITLAYKDSLGYFYTFFNNNNNTAPVTDYRVYLQMKILRTLLDYLTSKIVNLPTSYKLLFSKAFNNTLISLESSGIKNDYYLIYSFNQYGNPIDSTEYFSTQIGILYLYKTMEKNNWILTNLENKVLNNSFDMFTKFYNQQNKLFSTSDRSTTYQFGSNLDGLRGILNLQQFFSTNANYSIFGINGFKPNTTTSVSLIITNNLNFDISFLVFSFITAVCIRNFKRKHQ